MQDADRTRAGSGGGRQCWGRANGGWFEFLTDANTNSPVLLFHYPSSQPAGFDYLKRSVKLEFGSLTDQQPVGRHPVRPWVADVLPDAFPDWRCEVVALEVERSFWEKATILHTEYHRPAEKPTPDRFSRHYADTAALAKHPTASRAIDQHDLREPGRSSGRDSSSAVRGRTTTRRSPGRFASSRRPSGCLRCGVITRRCGTCISPSPPASTTYSRPWQTWKIASIPDPLMRLSRREPPDREVAGRPEHPRRAGVNGPRRRPAQRVMCSTTFRVTSFSVRL